MFAPVDVIGTLVIVGHALQAMFVAERTIRKNPPPLLLPLADDRLLSELDDKDDDKDDAEDDEPLTGPLLDCEIDDCEIDL